MDSDENITLPEFVDLLKLAHGSAVERLDHDTPPWVALGYIDEQIATMVDDQWHGPVRRATMARRQWRSLNEHRRARALLVGLALSLGADPGRLGLGVMLLRSRTASPERDGWIILATDIEIAIVPTATMAPQRRELQAPELAAIPADEPMTFLTRAVRWRLEQP